MRKLAHQSVAEGISLAWAAAFCDALAIIWLSGFVNAAGSLWETCAVGRSAGCDDQGALRDLVVPVSDLDG